MRLFSSRAPWTLISRVLDICNAQNVKPQFGRATYSSLLHYTLSRPDILYNMSRRSGYAHKANVSQKRLRVLVDMDGVMCDFEGSFLDKFSKKFPNEPTILIEERNTFYLTDQYSKIRPDLRERVMEIITAKGFFLELPEIPGGVEAVKEMSKIEDVDVFFCTSPLRDYTYCLQEKMQWLADHLGQEWTEKMILTKDKTMVNGHILIDDKPHIKGVCNPPLWQHVLFTSPMNRYDELRGRQRLDNWTDGKWREIIDDFKKRI